MSAPEVKETEPRHPEGLVRTLRDLRQILRFHQVLGISEYPLNEDVRRFLKCTDTLKSVQTGIKIGTAGPAPQVRAPEELSVASILAALRQEVEQCSICRLAATRLGTVPGHGPGRSILMVVGDWSSQELSCSPEVLFGKDEDNMLWKMMEAIALRPEEVYVTNILKCCPGADQIPDQECRESCFSYLVREIGAVRPGIICAMGDLAASVLVGSQEPLFRLRGRFALYRYQSTHFIPVMPTFHPRYLLRNPEMKKATWKDLQAIRRRLDQLGS